MPPSARTAKIKAKLPIFLFHGEDNYSSSQKLKYWKDEFIRKHGDTNLEILDGKDLTAGNFINSISTMPFLAEKRMVIINNFINESDEDTRKQVTGELENIPQSCVLIFYEDSTADKRFSIYKKLSDLGEADEFPVLPPDRLAKWVLEKSKTENFKISPAVANYLGSYCGSDLWKIDSELDKLKLFSNGREITKEMVELLTAPSIISSIFHLTDNIAEKNVKRSLKTLKLLTDSGEELSMIFHMIVRHFRILIQAKDMVSKNEPTPTISKKLNLKPFVTSIYTRQSKNFTQPKLEDVYSRLLTIDTEFKTGIIKTYPNDAKEFELAIEKLIVNCCR